MQTTLVGGFADAPRDAAHAFRAIMNATARPGRIQAITGATPPPPLSVAAGTVLLTLCDPETPLHLAGGFDVPQLRDWLAFHTGAPITGPDTCAFALGRWEDLQPLGRFPVGTSEYPDRSATLIVECDRLEEAGTSLTGPGIDGTAELSLPEVAAFQANTRAFPLGLDFLFTCGDRLAGLPRSTRVR